VGDAPREQARLERVGHGFNRYITDIDSYRDEMIVKFITGAEPISKFDEFVATIKKLNIDEVLKIRQAQYDRLK